MSGSFATLRCLIPAIALATVSSACAATYDAVEDFSVSGNPNGVWSYGTLSQLTGGTFSAFTFKDSGSDFTGSEAWYNDQAVPNDSAVEANTSGQTQSISVSGGGIILVPADQLRLDGENFIATVRWTAPANGVYNVSGLFQRNDNQANSSTPVPVTVSVVQDGATVLFQQGNFTAYLSQAPFDLSSLTLQAGETLDFVESSTVYHNDTTGLKVVITTGYPAFFSGETALANGVYYLALPNGNPFGYYSYLTNPNYIYHFDLGYEYIFDAADGHSGVYFYDFKSNDFFYTSPSFPFPYLYDFGLGSTVYYYPDPNNVGRYNTDGIRYFYVFNTGQIISK